LRQAKFPPRTWWVLPMDTEAKIFHFKATAPEGGTTTGRIDASSKAEAMAKLSARGFRPLRLSEGNIQESFWHRELVWGRRLSIAVARVSAAKWAY
jgi:type II secretory pathway component PulF